MLARSTFLLTAATPKRQARSRAYDGMDSGAMGFHLAPADRHRRDTADSAVAPAADIRRSSFAGESDSASVIARGRGDDIVSTTPVGSYINGVLGGSLHPALVDNDDNDEEDEEEETSGDASRGNQDADSKSLAQEAAEQVVRLRAENADLRERLLEAEQQLADSERQRAELQERLTAASEELNDANELLMDERRRVRSLESRGSDLQSAKRSSPVHPDFASPSPSPASPSPSPAAVGGNSLEADLELTNRRMEMLESNVLQLQRRLASQRAEEKAEEEAAAAVESDAESDYVTRLTNQALTTMTKEIAELRAGADTLRCRMRQLDERRRQQLRDIHQEKKEDELVSEEALLSVSVSLEASRRQNQRLQRQLNLNESEKLQQSRQIRRLETSAEAAKEAWSNWSLKAESSREDLHQLSNANLQLRDRLSQLDAERQARQTQLEASRSEAASKADLCRRMASDATKLQRRLRDSREEAALLRQSAKRLDEANDGLRQLLGLTESENREVKRRLLRLAESAVAMTTGELVRQVSEAAHLLRTDIQVTSDDNQQQQQQRESQVQLAALIHQVDLVESRGLTEPMSAAFVSKQQHQHQHQRHQHEHQRHQRKQQGNPNESIELSDTDESQRVEVQRLVRMLLYNSRNA